MTTVYFIRHAQSNRFSQDDRTRPLTDEGMEDTRKITETLKNAGITHILSSPYKRTIQTVTDLANTIGVSIETDEDFRERFAGNWLGDNFIEFIRRQWVDFNYNIMDGECLADVQKRNIAALDRAIRKYSGETIAIATHGTALSTIINYYYPEFNFDSFMRIIDYMPYVIKMTYDNEGNPIDFKEILIIEKKFK